MQHRDVTPSNVLITEAGTKIIDFGLVKFLDRSASPSSTRVALGTFNYAAPEQVLNSAAVAGISKAKADVYLLGATLLYLATGHPPRDGSTYEELMRQASEEDADLSGLDPYSPLYGLLESCLRRHWDLRPTMAQVRDDCARETEHGHEFAELLEPEVRRAISKNNLRLDRLAAACQGGPRPASLDPIAFPPVSEPHQGLKHIDPRASFSAGHHLWAVELPDWIQAGVTLVDSVVIIAAVDGTVAALDKATGEVRWSFNLDRAIRSAAVPLSDLPNGPIPVGEVCLGDAEGGLYGVSVESSRARPFLYAGGAIEAAPVVLRNWVYAASLDGCLYRADYRNYRPGDSGPFFHGDAELGELAAAPDTIYVSTLGAQLLAINAQTAQLRWRLATGGRVCAAPVLADEKIFYATANGIVGAADAAGDLLGTTELDAAVHAAPVCHGKQLYVGSSDGQLRAFPVSGDWSGGVAPTWKASVDGEVRGLTAEGDLLYVAANDTVVTLRAKDGTQEGAVYRMDSLIAAPPVVSDGRIYLTGLGGVVRCLAIG